MADILVNEEEYNSLQKQIEELKAKIKSIEIGMNSVHHLSNIFISSKSKTNRQRGSGKELIAFVSEDFDAPLEDFKEYL
jgi:prefoldin subunit 5